MSPSFRASLSQARDRPTSELIWENLSTALITWHRDTESKNDCKNSGKELCQDWVSLSLYLYRFSHKHTSQHFCHFCIHWPTVVTYKNELTCLWLKTRENVQNEGSGMRGDDAASPWTPQRANRPRNVGLSPWMKTASTTEQNLNSQIR